MLNRQRFRLDRSHFFSPLLWSPTALQASPNGPSAFAADVTAHQLEGKWFAEITPEGLGFWPAGGVQDGNRQTDAATTISRKRCAIFCIWTLVAFEGDVASRIMASCANGAPEPPYS
jgi:hypothetical protein